RTARRGLPAGPRRGPGPRRSQGAGRRASRGPGRHDRSRRGAAPARSARGPPRIRVPRTNPYLLNVFAWEARNGRLSTGLQCRIEGDKLQAKVDVLLSRLQLAKAGGRDEAQARIGLPLGMLVSLMKDRHGDIRLALPIAGRVTDPRVDFKQLVGSTVRNATLKVIAAPVSWIGRVRFDADSRIERIEVDPIQFEPGTATPTSEGQQQLTRLVAF